MTTRTKVGRLGIAGIAITMALTAALAGCGSSDKSDHKSTESKPSTSETTSSKTTSAKPKPTAPRGSGAHQTIQDYIKANNITETMIKPGDPGPSITLPVPDGWEVNNDLPEAPYGAIIYTASTVPDNPPRILAILSKLTGDVDPDQILALAPNELRNLPGFDGPEEGQPDSLAGYDAVRISGHYEIDGKKGMVAQKTVVIPGQDGLYVLQFNAYSDDSEAGILSDATDVVDEQTTITT